MRILINSISDRKELSDITFKRLKEYCDKHNYDLCTYDYSLDTSRHIAWSKICVLQEKMKKHIDYDYYIWIDDDIYITNIDKSIEELIKPYPFNNILMSADVYPSYPLNSGIIICKNNNFVKSFFNYVWIFGKRMDREWKHPWEQDPITFLYLKNLDKIKIIPHKVIQSFHRDYDLPEHFRWSYGDFSVHVTGMSLEKRLIELDNIIKICNENEKKNI